MFNKIKMIKILATIGPSSKEVGTLKDMVQAGMNIARLNFSHGTHESHGEVIKNVRQAAKELEVDIEIMLDLHGPMVHHKDGRSFEKEVSSFTEKDKEDVLFGIKHNVNYIALSGTKSVKDVNTLREFLKEQNSNIPIVAKIETKEGLRNFKSILAVSDMIMVARGDLATDIPLEKVPFAQKTMVELSNRAHKPVIVATEMLKSMVNESHPTRAEITDVANAILDGANIIMLSEETTIGKYPVETVATMRKIAEEAQMYPVTYDI